MPTRGPNPTKRGPIGRALHALRRFVVFIVNVLVARFGVRPRLVRRRAHSSNANYHLTQTQMRRIIAAGPCPRDRVLLQALSETGLRRAEIADLTVDDVRLEERLLIVWHGKGDKMRVVPLTQALAGNLAAFIGRRRVGSVFATSNGGPLSLRQINRIVARAGKLAGVSNPNPRQRQITCHLFRHSFARLWKANGGSIETLARILGHASVKTTWDLYGKESVADIQKTYRSTMRKIGDRREGNS